MWIKVDNEIINTNTITGFIIIDGNDVVYETNNGQQYYLSRFSNHNEANKCLEIIFNKLSKNESFDIKNINMSIEYILAKIDY